MMNDFLSLSLLTCLPISLFSESNWIIKQAAGAEKSGGRGAARHFRPMDAASNGGRAAAHRPHGAWRAAGAWAVRHRAGPGCGRW